MLTLKLQYFGHLMRRADSFEKTLMLEILRAEGEGDNRGWDGWMASPTQWTWVWVDCGSWRWTGRPGVLQSMGLKSIRHDWVTEPNWTEPGSFLHSNLFLMLLGFPQLTHFPTVLSHFTPLLPDIWLPFFPVFQRYWDCLWLRCVNSSPDPVRVLLLDTIRMYPWKLYMLLVFYFKSQLFLNVWQKPLQYCKVISLQLIKINGKKKQKKKSVILP